MFARESPLAKDRWFTSIFDAFGIESVESMLKKSDRLCLYYYKKPSVRVDYKIPSEVLVGTHIIDTQRCPRRWLRYIVIDVDFAKNFDIT